MTSTMATTTMTRPTTIVPTTRTIVSPTMSRSTRASVDALPKLPSPHHTPSPTAQTSRVRSKPKTSQKFSLSDFLEASNPSPKKTITPSSSASVCLSVQSTQSCLRNSSNRRDHRERLRRTSELLLGTKRSVSFRTTVQVHTIEDTPTTTKDALFYTQQELQQMQEHSLEEQTLEKQRAKECIVEQRKAEKAQRKRQRKLRLQQRRHERRKSSSSVEDSLKQSKKDDDKEEKCQRKEHRARTRPSLEDLCGGSLSALPFEGDTTEDPSDHSDQDHLDSWHVSFSHIEDKSSRRTRSSLLSDDNDDDDDDLMRPGGKKDPQQQLPTEKSREKQTEQEHKRRNESSPQPSEPMEEDTSESESSIHLIVEEDDEAKEPNKEQPQKQEEQEEGVILVPQEPSQKKKPAWQSSDSFFGPPTPVSVPSAATHPVTPSPQCSNHPNRKKNFCDQDADGNNVSSDDSSSPPSVVSSSSRTTLSLHSQTVTLPLPEYTKKTRSKSTTLSTTTFTAVEDGLPEEGFQLVGSSSCRSLLEKSIRNSSNQKRAVPLKQLWSSCRSIFEPQKPEPDKPPTTRSPVVAAAASLKKSHSERPFLRDARRKLHNKKEAIVQRTIDSALQQAQAPVTVQTEKQEPPKENFWNKIFGGKR
jgi:hypothetical protein